MSRWGEFIPRQADDATCAVGHGARGSRCSCNCVDVFADAGNAFDRFGDPLEYSVGVGFRWRSPIGLIGGDIAQPLSVDGQGLRLHFSVRPEL